MLTISNSMERFRMQHAGRFSSTVGFVGGAFQRDHIRMIVGVGDGWEHVSVSRNDKQIPTWDDMNKVKNWFWEEEDAVMQLHPPKSQYLSYPDVEVLHLWRPLDAHIPMPPMYMV